jgi:hypothetical protein
MQAPIMKAAIVPLDQFQRLIEFFHAHNGHKGHHYTVGAKARARVQTEMENACVVNVTTENIASQPQEVKRMVEETVMK